MRKLDKRIWYILIGLAIIAFAWLSPVKKSTLILLTSVGVYGIAAIGYNILLGYSGQISLGHAAFIGLGAYVSAYVTHDMGLPFWVGVLAAALIPILLGLLLGGVALRLEGHYLAIATLGFGVAIQQTFKVLTGFTNGFAGKIAPTATILGLKLKSGAPYFTLTVVVVVVAAILAHNLIHSKTGRALIAMRDAEHAAQAMGINVVKYKLIAFSVSAAYAGVAGALYMHMVKYTQPDVWGMVLSVNLLAMVVIGGLTSIGGSILGAAVITLLPHVALEIPLLKDINSSSIILTGLVIVMTIRFLPGGVVRLGPWLLSKLSKPGASQPKEVA